MVCRLLYDKGYKEYVEAAKIIKKEFPDVEFIIVGDIDEAYPNHVPKSVVENDVNHELIKYLGFKQDVRELMSISDCIVLPSYHEGLSRVLMEALAMGRPIITTDIPGCRETVDDGITGFICKPQDTQSLAEIIKKFVLLSASDRNKMGKAGRLKAQNIFDIQKVVQVYHSITDKYL